MEGQQAVLIWPISGHLTCPPGPHLTTFSRSWLRRTAISVAITRRRRVFQSDAAASRRFCSLYAPSLTWRRTTSRPPTRRAVVARSDPRAKLLAECRVQKLGWAKGFLSWPLLTRRRHSEGPSQAAVEHRHGHTFELSRCSREAAGAGRASSASAVAIAVVVVVTVDVSATRGGEAWLHRPRRRGWE